MPRFQVAKAGAAPCRPAAPSAALTETPLNVLASMVPLPIHPVHTTGRVHWLCATSTKYPNYKVIVSSKAEEGNEAVFMMVKCNAIPPVDIGVDSVIQICHAELRNAYTKRTDGTIAEQALFPRLCSRELSVNLSAGSRKRGRSVASLGCICEQEQDEHRFWLCMV